MLGGLLLITEVGGGFAKRRPTKTVPAEVPSPTDSGVLGSVEFRLYASLVRCPGSRQSGGIGSYFFRFLGHSHGKKAGATRAVEAKTTGIRPPLIEAYVSVGFFPYFSPSLWLFKLIRANSLCPFNSAHCPS